MSEGKGVGGCVSRLRHTSEGEDGSADRSADETAGGSFKSEWDNRRRRSSEGLGNRDPQQVCPMYYRAELALKVTHKVMAPATGGVLWIKLIIIAKKITSTLSKLFGSDRMK